MKRTTFRNLWIVGMITLLGSAYYVFKKSSEFQTLIEIAKSRKERLVRDLKAGNQLSAALADLDALTINEKKATRLDILRHLDLEKSELYFQTGTKTQRRFGPVTLYKRNFTFSGELPYAEALAEMDAMQATNKVAIQSFRVKKGDGLGDKVQFTLKGVLYGLDKR